MDKKTKKQIKKDDVEDNKIEVNEIEVNEIEVNEIEMSKEIKEEENSIDNKLQKNKRNKLSIIALVAFLLVIGIGVLLKEYFSYITFDMKEYVNVIESGYDGYGNIAIDYNTDYSNDIKKQSKESINKFLKSIKVDYDENDKLKNGEEVKISIKYSESAAKRLKLKVINSKYTYIVSKLEKVDGINYFDNFDVTFDGISPYMTAKPNVGQQNDYVYSNVTYELSKTENLAIGDKIVVKLIYDKETMSANGYNILEDSKEYVVGDGPKYITSVDELSENNINEIKEFLQNKLDATMNREPLYEALGWKNGVSYIYQKVLEPKYSSNFDRSLKYESSLEKNYFLTLNDITDKSKEFNRYYALYKITFKPSAGKTGSGTMYVMIKISNIVLSDGEIVYDYKEVLDFSNMSKTDETLLDKYVNIATYTLK